MAAVSVALGKISCISLDKVSHQMFRSEFGLQLHFYDETKKILFTDRLPFSFLL